jgi:hypothetical protein
MLPAKTGNRPSGRGTIAASSRGPAGSLGRIFGQCRQLSSNSPQAMLFRHGLRLFLKNIKRYPAYFKPENGGAFERRRVSIK